MKNSVYMLTGGNEVDGTPVISSLVAVQARILPHEFAKHATMPSSQAGAIVSYRAYRILIHGIFAMLVAFFLFGSRVVWSNCLTGLAWRAWLLLYALPAWVTIAIPQE